MINTLTEHPLIAAIAIALLFGIGLIGSLIFSTIRYKKNDDGLVEKINHLLPQTQCGECGYPGCKPYATAVADGDALNKCLPGGKTTIRELAKLLDRKILALDGEEKLKSIAYIREAECIGCTKCIQACPVDAIFGAAKYMHTIIASECTGCDLCVDPCPVNCIEMRPVKTTIDTWHWELPVSTEYSAELIATDRKNQEVA